MRIDIPAPDLPAPDLPAPDIPAFVSTREAIGVLVDAGHTARMARRLLAAGLAGEPLRARGAVQFEASRVLDLAVRRSLSREEVDRICPRGVFVARRLEAVAGPWAFSWLTAVRLRVSIEEGGPYPLVVALSGIVVEGAEIVAVHPVPGGEYTLRLGPPSPWFDALRDRRCPTGPGRAWALHLPGRPRVGESAA